MATILDLTKTRDNLVVQIAGVTADLREYTKNPCETVDIEQIKYQYCYILREIKQIDFKIKTIILSQMEGLKVEFKNLETQLEIEQSKKHFNIIDLPKFHFSMFNEPFL